MRKALLPWVIAVGLCLLVVACRKKESAESALGEIVSPVQYYPDSLKDLGDGWHGVDVEMAGPVVRQKFYWKTNCQGRFFMGQQELYDSASGALTSRLPAESNARLVESGSPFEALQEAVCQQIRAGVSKVSTLSPDSALVMIYGNADPKGPKSAVQNICLSDAKSFENCLAAGGEVTVERFKLDSDANGETAMMVTKTSGFDDAFPAYLGLFSFVRKEGLWQVDGWLPYWMVADGIGGAIGVEKIQLGSARWGWLLTRDQMVEGVSGSVAMIVATLETAVTVLWRETLSADNGEICRETQAEPCWGFESVLQLDRTASGEWWDLLLVREGNVLRNGLVVDATGKMRFRMGRNGYRRGR